MKNKQKDHRIAVLNDVNDADVFLVVSEKNVALRGDHNLLVASVASAIVSHEDFRRVISEAINLVMGIKAEA